MYVFKERLFLVYPHKFFPQSNVGMIAGLSAGFGIALLVFCLIITYWYSRKQMNRVAVNPEPPAEDISSQVFRDSRIVARMAELEEGSDAEPRPLATVLGTADDGTIGLYEEEEDIAPGEEEEEASGHMFAAARWVPTVAGANSGGSGRRGQPHARGVVVAGRAMVVDVSHPSGEAVEISAQYVQVLGRDISTNSISPVSHNTANTTNTRVVH